MNDSNSKDTLIDERAALLNYYNSQCMRHGAYVVSLLVGVSVLISRWDAFSPNLLTFSVFSGITNGIIIMLAYAIGRSFFWGALATKVMQIDLENPREGEEKIIQEHEKGNMPSMYILHKVTINRAERSVFYRIFGKPKLLAPYLVQVFVGAVLILIGAYLLFQS